MGYNAALDPTDFHFMDKNMNISQNILFCIPQKKVTDWTAELSWDSPIRLWRASSVLQQAINTVHYGPQGVTQPAVQRRGGVFKDSRVGETAIFKVTA